MFTVWYFLWNIIFFIYTLFFNFIIKFIFNKKPDTVLDTENELLKFLNKIYFMLSPVNILNTNKNFNNDELLYFYLKRSHRYPFLAEIISVYDVNVGPKINMNINFKSLYKEFIFYSNNKKTNNIKLALTKFFENYLILNTENNHNIELLNFMLLTKIIYNNFFFNFKRLGFFNKKITYSYSLNFLVIFYIYKNCENIKNTKQFNTNYIINNVNSSYVYKIDLKNFRNNIPFSLNISRNINKYLNSINLFIQWGLKVNDKFCNKIYKTWPIRFSNSSITKYIDYNSINKYKIYYLRKTKIFNKGRYSRNRQTYRTGVYWSLYLNIILMIGLFFWFYRFTINFGYLWWFFYIFIVSFLVPKIIKYKFYNPVVLIKSFVLDVAWLLKQLIVVKNNFKDFLYKVRKIVKNALYL